MPQTPDLPFPEDQLDAENDTRRSTGILPSQALRRMIGLREIDSEVNIDDDQVQPASLDLRLGHVAYRVRASFLPGPQSHVQSKIDAFGMHEIDLSRGAVLERGCVYIVPLLENLTLGKSVSGLANPKSSAGRLDIFTRLIADCAGAFDKVPKGYRGPLYAEISPGTFSILVRTGTRLNQLRLRRGNPRYYDGPVRQLHEREGLVGSESGKADISGGVAFTADLTGTGDGRPIGYRANKHAALIDFDKPGHYDWTEFWEPIFPKRNASLILDPGDFYILASKESVTVPPDYAAEMRAYDTLVGEFRVHYAGFFDPGFGHADAGGDGSRAVLEVRSHDVPFVLEDGQTVGRLLYERLTETPDLLYGPSIGSTYQRQGLMLGKQFKQAD